jgi:hypothetical protein
MKPTYAAAIEHMRVMENRIRHQEAAIHLLKNESRDTTDAERRLTLLHAVSQEMRIQLAQLAPTAEQVAAPAWVLPLGLLDTKRTQRS